MTGSDRKQRIVDELARVRAKTLMLLKLVPLRAWNLRVHDFYSPIGWHFGHIGMTEEHWTCTRALGRPAEDERLCFLYANIPENPKDNRIHLPPREEVANYLSSTREHALSALHDADLGSADPLRADGYAWEFALQHECQHQETICELLQLIMKHYLELRDYPEHAELGVFANERRDPRSLPANWRKARGSGMISLPGAAFEMGSDNLHDYDNEKSAHAVTVEPFELDLRPVNVADWLLFMHAGGYQRSEYWCGEGAAWLAETGAISPEYWHRAQPGKAYYSPTGLRSLKLLEPVSSISWFEADAYARWAGKRLPTEKEWEFAAAFDPETGRARRYPWGDDPEPAIGVDCDMIRAEAASVNKQTAANAMGLRGMAGGVWEWTSSSFLPYPSFEPFPYDGYSKEHMDGKHFVCRGGSWATDPRILRTSFRNWYPPSYRQGFLGMRCAL